MKEYLVDTDVTISVRMYVTAESEEDAKQQALKEISAEPMYHTYHKGCFVNVVITDVYEEK